MHFLLDFSRPIWIALDNNSGNGFANCLRIKIKTSDFNCLLKCFKAWTEIKR